MSLTPQQKGPPPRPKQIAYAVYFIVSAIVISALLQVTAVLTTGQESGGYYADPLNLLCLGAAHLISLYVALMIALGKSWARILFLIGFALEFINAVMEAGGNLDNLFVAALLAFTTILDIIAIYLLYRPASSAWFEARKAYEAAQMAGDDGQAEEGASPAAAGAEQAPGVDLPVGKAVIMAGGVGALLGLAERPLLDRFPAAAVGRRARADLFSAAQRGGRRRCCWGRCWASPCCKSPAAIQNGMPCAGR